MNDANNEADEGDEKSHRQILNQAVRYLSYREHAVEELRFKLARKFEQKTIINQVLQSLLSDDLVNEQRYAGSYIRSRANRGYGPERIRGELRQKGLASALIENALASSCVEWDAELNKVWLKKYGHLCQNEAGNMEMAVQMRFLHYRGFSHEQIKRFFDEHVASSSPN